MILLTALEDIQSMPAFFEAALNWGIQASYGALAFMSLMVLAVYMFKK